MPAANRVIEVWVAKGRASGTALTYWWSSALRLNCCLRRLKGTVWLGRRMRGLTAKEAKHTCYRPKRPSGYWVMGTGSIRIGAFGSRTCARLDVREPSFCVAFGLGRLGNAFVSWDLAHDGRVLCNGRFYVGVWSWVRIGPRGRGMDVYAPQS